MKSVLSKTSGFLYEWQWKRLWQLLASGCGGLFLHLLDRYYKWWRSRWSSLLLALGCEGVWFLLSVLTWLKWQWSSLWWRLFPAAGYGTICLVKLQAFSINGSEGACDGVCFYFQVFAESDFSIVSGLYNKCQ